MLSCNNAFVFNETLKRMWRFLLTINIFALPRDPFVDQKVEKYHQQNNHRDLEIGVH